MTQPARDVITRGPTPVAVSTLGKCCAQDSGEVWVRVLYPVAYGGLRAVVAALSEAGTGVHDRLREEFAREAVGLLPGSPQLGPHAGIVDTALTPSERRLHPQSEQVFRVLHAAADAVVATLSAEEVMLELEDVGAMDVPSVRGLLRFTELAAWRGVLDALSIQGLGARSMLSDFLRRKGLPSPEVGLVAERLRLPMPSAPAGVITTDDVATDRPVEAALLAIVLDDEADAVDRVAAAVESARRSFFTADHEVMNIVALIGSDLCRLGTAVDGPAVVECIHRQGITSAFSEAMEFEVGVLRRTADVEAFFHKALGIVHSFRGQYEQAVTEFSHIESDERVSVELRAQAILYRALTRVKMLRDPAAGRTEADRGLALLAEHGTGTEQSQRERGWLLNVRALCAFREGNLTDATRDEKAALRCVESLTDASSLHLKINLISNISVLQEQAGRPAAAVRTWERFSNVGTGWDVVFRKHHSYRLGGLALAAGDHERAWDAFDDAYRACEELGDLFHQTAIGVELGTLALDGGREEPAVRMFSTAARTADRFGDPYQYALARIGAAVAAGTVPDADLKGRARLSYTYADRVAALVAALDTGDRSPLCGLLPSPRTKLNRPFDHVAVR